MLEFVLRALIGGTGIALVAAPMGCVILWQRMAFFGDALAHASLLGVSLGLLLHLSPFIGIASMGILFALCLAWLDKRMSLSSDTLLSILSQSTLALGLICLSQIPGAQPVLMRVLLGDILAISWQDVWVVLLGGTGVLIGLVLLWERLLCVTVDPELATLQGFAPVQTRAYFTLLLAVVVAIAIQFIGALLIVALLIIPAATARPWARTPEGMVVFSAVIAVVSVVLGIAASFMWNFPTGPAIVIACTSCFLLSNALRCLR